MPGRSGRDEMQGVAPTRSYGAPLGAQAPVNATDRPKVGPASPDVQRAAIAKNQADSSREARAGLYQKPVGSQASTPAARPPAAAAGAQPVQSHAMDAYGPLGRAVGQIQANPANLNNAIDEQSK